MDICIVSDNLMLSRFLELELCEAGYSVQRCNAPCENALLCIADLDSYLGELPKSCIGFSEDAAKSKNVPMFIQRPIDTAKLLDAVKSKLPSAAHIKKTASVTVNVKTRTASAYGGEVRLSKKELSLLVALVKSGTLTRAGGRELFGEDSNALDVYVHYLRKKLAVICDAVTVSAKRGEGYSLTDEITVSFI